MNKSILITGVAGSGKSSVCRELKKLEYKAYDIEDIKGLFTTRDKITGNVVYDHDNDNLELVKKHDWICDKNKLQKLINKNKRGIVFYCGGASNFDELIPLFDKVFLLKISPKTLHDRLSLREPGESGNTLEVREWILSWKNWWEGHMVEKGAIVIDANRSLREIANDIVEKSKSSK